MAEPISAPVATVVIPAYQMERWIEQAIQSVLSQPLAVEIIVVDDASTDRTVEIAEGLLAAAPHAMVLRNARPKGVSGTRNTGLGHASAPWVLFLDADDVLLPGSLPALLDSAKAGDVAVLGAFGAIDEAGDAIDDSWADELGGWLDEHGAPSVVDLRELALSNIMPPPGAQLLSAEDLRAIGGFDEVLIARGGSEDFELLARLSWRGTVRLIDDNVLAYRRRSGSQSSRSDHNIRRARSRLVAMRRSPRWQRPVIGWSLATRYARLGVARSLEGARRLQVRTLARGIVNLGIAGACALAGVAALALPSWTPSWEIGRP